MFANSLLSLTATANPHPQHIPKLPLHRRNTHSTIQRSTLPGAGAITAALFSATGRETICAGKPFNVGFGMRESEVSLLIDSQSPSNKGIGRRMILHERSWLETDLTPISCSEGREGLLRFWS